MAPAARSGRGQGQDFFSDVGLEGEDFLAIGVNYAEGVRSVTPKRYL
jgi:hypothetical protein